MKITQETLDTLNEYGYNNLDEYLQDLADDSGLRVENVEAMALILGESELFDGLVTACEDFDIYDGWNPNDYEDD